RGALVFFFFASRRRHTRFSRDWSSDVCSSDLGAVGAASAAGHELSAVPPPVVSGGGESGGSWGCVVSTMASAFWAGERCGQLRRSEERRVGNEGRSRRGPCRASRGGPAGSEPQ